MDFWKLHQSHDAVAVIDARSGQTWTYGQLRAEAQTLQEQLPRRGQKTLGLLLAQNRYECLVAYVAALNSDCALILMDGALDTELLAGLLNTYQPDWIIGGGPFAGYSSGVASAPALLMRDDPQLADIHPELALLLSTSGSTGSPKLVRLTLKSLAANAASIAQYLSLTSDDRPITSLPMPYSYGLSVINSHWSVGATIVLTEDGVLRREFWDAVDRYSCTSFAGVPYTYQLLLQTGLLSKRGALKTLTQAGGRLEERLIEQMLKLSDERGWRFFVMYGQTEATARIAYVPQERLREKVGSVGIAIPGGTLAIDNTNGELLYAGPNVMMGYAECRADLAKGDELDHVLRTGDLARQDEEGFFYINGRLKRFLKLFGKRFNLDDVEVVLSKHFAEALACYGRDDLLTVALEECSDTRAATDAVCQIFDLPRTSVKVISLLRLPRTANGKLDYQRLNQDAQE